MQEFKSYGDKSSAKRGFARTFKDAELDVEKFLDKQDSKWGFHILDGKPVDISVPPVVEEKEEVAPEPDAFSKFAFAQLTSPKAPEIIPVAPVSVPTASKHERNRPESNGVKRPSTGTVCASIWDIASSLSLFKQDGSIQQISRLIHVVAAAEAAGINKYTARTQYARWRVFHGFTGKVGE